MKIVNKIKKKTLDFAVKHRDFILKYVPQNIISFFEKRTISGLNDFKRVTKFNPNLKRGINVVGLLKAQFGLGQASRLICKAIEKSKFDFAAIDTNIGPGKKYGDTTFDSILTKEFPYNINILHCQPHTNFEIMISQIGIKNLEQRYNIAFWLWELDKIPEEWKNSFKYVNEIWTCSSFVADAFKKETDLPIHVIPYAIEPKKNEKLKRVDFHIPEDKFCFLTMFDSGSSSMRKNPMDVIDAFVKAFPNNDKVCLVVKISNSIEEDLILLKNKLKNVKHYVFIDEVLPQADVYSLISLCDVFVSLHRSEGFGLPLAEAMALKTVCIATNYSGNTDFMNEENACLVDYKLVPVNLKNHVVYKEGNVWAQPNVEQASFFMQKLYKDKKLYNKLQKNAQAFIKKELSFDGCIQKIENRIDTIVKENNL